MHRDQLVSGVSNNAELKCSVVRGERESSIQDNYYYVDVLQYNYYWY